MPHLSKVPFHPILFALFPTITLYAYNIHEVPGSVIWRPLLISLAGALLFLVLLRLLLRDWLKAALITSFLLLLFFTYGRVYDYLKTTPLASLNIVRHRYLAMLFIALLILAIWFTLKLIRDIQPVTSAFNIMAIVIIVVPIFQISTYSINSASRAQAASKWTPSTSLIINDQYQDKPDVYYIILDTYTRSDVLLNELGFDNSEFINQLEKMGFFVADCSRSNYNNTTNSIVSSLNMSYLPKLYEEGATRGISRSDIWMLIKPNAVRRNFEALGYKSVAFDTGYRWTSIDDASLYLTREGDSFGLQFINPFERMLIDSSVLSIYTDYLLKTRRDKYFGASNINANYIGQQEFILDQLPRIAEISGPTFTYAHINIPHNPFVFSLHGYLTDPGDVSGPEADAVHFPLGYLHAIEYINARILTILQEIFDKSSLPPIIIIQGDHGYWKDGGGISPILNSFFLPGLQESKFYPTITPVNTFRLVFNEYFDGHYELLPDESFDVKDVTNPLPEVFADCLK
jgi:hypothetical protein